MYTVCLKNIPNVEKELPDFNNFW